MFRVSLVVTAIVMMAFLVGCSNEPDPVPAAENVAATAVSDLQASATTAPTLVPTLVPTPVNTLGAPASPTPIATATASPTPIATDTPVPTNTPLPTNPPLPTATFVPPTATPTLAPTATSAPAPDAFGMTATFSVEGSLTYRVNQDIWFNFELQNPNRVEVRYGALGMYPRKDGVDRLDLFQFSWSNATTKPEGLKWRDHINLPEPGTYKVRIAICLAESRSICESSSTAKWVTLSPNEITITVQ